MGMGAPIGLSTEAGSSQMSLSWQIPDEEVEAGGASGSSVRGTGGSEPSHASDLSYEVAWTKQDAEWSEGASQTSDTLEATVTGLENGQTYAFRVRAQQGEETSAWSETVHATPTGAATLIEEFPDLSLANSVTHDLDMTKYFSGAGLSYGVMVTTTNKRTGEVRTKPLNTVARNKVTGGWSGQVLTLTTGTEGEHMLTLEITATDADGGTASDSFELTVGAEDSAAEGPAGEVAPADTAPSFGDAEIPDQSWRVDDPVSLNLPAASGGNGALTYELRLAQAGEPGAPARRRGARSPHLRPWGRGRKQRRRGRALRRRPALHLDGDAACGERWLAGAALSMGRAATRYDADAVTGTLESDMLSLTPYFRGEFGERTELWGFAGIGQGSALNLRPETVQGSVLPFDPALPPAPEQSLLEERGDLRLTMGSLGARHALRPFGPAQLALIGDYGLSELAVRDGEGALLGLAASANRMRLSLEGSVAAGGFTGFLRVSARSDGGDGVTGEGMELTSGLSDAAGRFETSLSGRWLAAHTAEEYRESSLSASVTWRPREDGSGWMFTMTPAWGAGGSAGAA